jgi:hypothetical protein
MLCEERMTIAKARSVLQVPQNIKLVIPTKAQSNIGKTYKNYRNCGMKNHNVETCREKKE